MLKYLPVPKSFYLQWHLTERCNWKCSHCYQDDDNDKNELTTKQIVTVITQFKYLVSSFGLSRDYAKINLTGGEPFKRDDIYQIINQLHLNRKYLNWGLLSNGSMLNEKTVAFLKEKEIRYIQVSIEGDREHNDNIRGKGSFEKTIKTIKLLVSYKIPTAVSLTLTQNNIDSVPSLARIFGELGVWRFSTRRLISIGRGEKLKDSMLSARNLNEYYINIMKLNSDLRKNNSKMRLAVGCESGIFNQHIRNRMHGNFCGMINSRALTLMPNGDVYPCRRLPVKVGNVLEKSLFYIYYSSNALWKLRNINNAHSFCKACSNFKSCYGGALCIKHCSAGKLFIPDTQCLLTAGKQFEEEPESRKLKNIMDKCNQ
jgi:radical SAM protein with 4Fe4S-binding SPASM domain